VNRRAPARDVGETLIELLVTVVILGIATAGLTGALLTTGKASTLHRQQALTQNALRSWAEQVGAAPYADCATAAGIGAPSPALPVGLTAAVTSVRYWNGTSFVASCGPDTGVQKVTLRITAVNGLSAALVRSIAVVLRKPCVSTC
jgi:type II secretory pathway pseudopilin PulG